MEDPAESPVEAGVAPKKSKKASSKKVSSATDTGLAARLAELEARSVPREAFEALERQVAELSRQLAAAKSGAAGQSESVAEAAPDTTAGPTVVEGKVTFEVTSAATSRKEAVRASLTGNHKGEGSNVCALPMEHHKLSSSVWVTSFFIGLSRRAHGASLLSAMLFVANLVVQCIFLSITMTKLSKTNYHDKKIKQLSDWRRAVGHSVKFYDSTSLTSLVQRVCDKGTNYPVEMSNSRADELSLIDAYLPEASNGTLGGPAVCIMAVICWSLTVMAELCDVFETFVAIAALPRHDPDGSPGSSWAGGETVVHRVDLADDTSTFRLSSVSRGRCVWIMFVNTLRGVFCLLLWYYGSLFLIHYSIDVASFLLNAGALAIVINVDEAFFILAPGVIRNLVSKMEPLRGPKKRFSYRGLDFRSVALSVALSIGVGVICSVEIIPLLAKVREAKATLCDGNTEFVYGLDPFYFIYASSTNPLRLDREWLQDLPHNDAIEELMSVPDILKDAELSMKFLGRGVDPVVRRANLDSSEAGAMIQHKYGVECKDLLQPTSYDLIPFMRLFGKALDLENVTSCKDIEPLCYEDEYPGILAVCPETCGCGQATGKVLRTAAAFGCPSSCLGMPLYFEHLESMPCREFTPEELRNNEVWKAWAKQFGNNMYRQLKTSYPEMHREMCSDPDDDVDDDCEDMWLSKGCGVIKFWRENGWAREQGINPCDGDWLLPGNQMTRSIRMVCPQTCGCMAPNMALKSPDELAALNCPGKCSTAP